MTAASVFSAFTARAPVRVTVRPGSRGAARSVVCALLMVTASAVARAQTDVELIAAALKPLDERRRGDATVAVESSDGSRHILQTGTNGWVCRLALHRGSFAQCYQSAVRDVFMSVQRHGGRMVAGLQASEVFVEQDGIQCNVISLEPGPDRMRVSLIVDDSVWATRSLPSLRAALRLFLDAVPAEHDVGLVTVSGSKENGLTFARQRSELRQRVSTLFPVRSGKGFLDRIVETWERHYDPRENVWPVFVIVGHDHGLGAGVGPREYERLVSNLRGRQATVHSIMLSNVQGKSSVAVAIALARATGGTFRSLATPTALPNVLSELGTVLGERFEEGKDLYRIVYDCADSPPEGDIRVGVRPAVTVRLQTDRRSGQ